MVLFQRQTVVDAPFDRVWDFHAGIDGLTAVTPDWMGLEVDAIVGKTGTETGTETEAEDLQVGTRIELSFKPLGLVPAGSWTAQITAREVGTNAAWFRDEMIDGPFQYWVHTHRFTAVDGGTRIQDHVEYELPVAHRLSLSGIAHPFFELMFWDRHRRTARLLAD